MYSSNEIVFHQSKPVDRTVRSANHCRRHFVEISLASFGAKVDRCIGRADELKTNAVEHASFALDCLNHKLKSRCQSVDADKEKVRRAWFELKSGLRGAWQNLKAGWSRALDRLH